MDNETQKSNSARLINPTIRNYMDTLNLQRFYGGYVVTPLPDEVYNLGIGEVGNIPLEEELFSVYQRYLQQEQRDRLALRYSGTLGNKETNTLQAEWMNSLMGEARFNADLVVSLDGGQNAVSAALRVFTSPLGSTTSKKQYVLLAAPTYPYFSAIVTAQAGMQAFLAYDGEQFTKGVETYCNPSVGVILVNIPNNPMGYSLTPEQAERINRVARTYDCAIVVDMVYATFAPDETLGKTLAAFDADRTVFADSFSKRFGFPGLRIGFALSTEPELTYALRFVKTSESLSPSHVGLAFAGHLLTHYSSYPKGIAETVRQRCKRFIETFQPPENSGAQLFPGRDNPFYLGLDLGLVAERAGGPDIEMVPYLQEKHLVRVYPGSFVYPNSALGYESFTQAGRLNPGGLPTYLAPSFPEGAPVVYAPDFFAARKPMFRLSFGSEERVEAAALALSQGLQALMEGKMETKTGTG